MWGGGESTVSLRGQPKQTSFFFFFLHPPIRQTDRQIKKEASGNKKDGPLNSFPLFLSDVGN